MTVIDMVVYTVTCFVEFVKNLLVVDIILSRFKTTYDTINESVIVNSITEDRIVAEVSVSYIA